MTQLEIENELKSLRNQLKSLRNELKSLGELEEARKKNWRSIRSAALISAIAFAFTGVGFVVFSVAYPKGGHETIQTAMMFIMLSLPMSLLAGALR